MNIVGDSLSRVPLLVTDGEEPVGPANPIQSLLDQPNHLQSRSQFLKTAAANLLLDGNCYIYLGMPNSYGVPREMLVLPPELVCVHREKRDRYTIDGYALRLDAKTSQIIPRDRIVHLQYAPNPKDPTCGIGPLAAAWSTVNQDNLASLWNTAVLRNSGTPAGVLRWKGDGVFDEEDAQLVRERWETTYAGTDKAESIAVLGSNFEFQSIGASAKDMQFLEAKRWNLSDIARAFNIPLVFLGEYEASGLSDAGLKIQTRLLYTSNIIPLGAEFDQALTKRLCVGEYGAGYTIRFDFDGVEAMREDIGQKIEAAQGLISLGYSPNEANIKLNMGMPEIDEGDVRFIDASKVPFATLVAQEAAIAAEQVEESPLMLDVDPGTEEITDAEIVAPADGEAENVETVDATGELNLLNGAQIKAVIDLVTQVTEGIIPKDSALGILQVVYGFTPAQSKAILGSAEEKPDDTPDETIVVESAESVPSQERAALRFKKLRAPVLREKTGLVALALVFNADKWEREKAHAWMQGGEYEGYLPQSNGNAIRYVSDKHKVSDFVEGSFRTVKFDDGVAAILGRIKADYIDPDTGEWRLPDHRRELSKARMEPAEIQEERTERHAKKWFNDWRVNVQKTLARKSPTVTVPDDEAEE